MTSACAGRPPAATALLGGQLRLRGDAAWVWVEAARPLWTLSSALVGGGLGERRHFCNFYVRRDYAGADPAGDLRAWLASRGLASGHCLAMMTAVPLARRCVVERRFPGGALAVVVTAGVGNAVDITAPPCEPLCATPGTINTQVFVDAHLSDAGLVNACLSASEARSRALFDRQVRDPRSGTLATGTSTDCLAIAATQRGPASDYAGSATALGRALGRAVYAATLGSLSHTAQGVP